MNRILIVEDEPAISNLIQMNLAAAGYCCDCAFDGAEAADRLEQEGFDLILLDIMLPEIDGYELMDYIRPLEIPVIFLTAKANTEDKVKGLKAGADDYLTKPFHMDELLARIFSLIRRYTRFNRDRNSQEILQYEGLCVNIDERSVKTGNGTFELPPKEFDVLMFLAENQGKILTKQRIYEAVWKEPYVYDDNNIMAVISRLRKKLEENPANPRYIQTIKGIGYRFNREV